MSRPIAVLRPEPGNRVTAAAVEERGLAAIRLPLFQVRPIVWQPPEAGAFDALILTSANTIRHAGPELSNFLDLPVHAVGEATAKAAERAGFGIASVGTSNAAELISRLKVRGIKRALHLTGREHTLEVGGIIAALIQVYASEALTIDGEALEALSGSVALIQSPRAGARLAELIADRASIRIAAVSHGAASAAGGGWEQIAVAASPTTTALLNIATRLAD